MVFVISGPSGAGKGTVIARVREHLPGLDCSVSATTRPPRPGEVDGREYRFLSEEEFEERVREGRFLEWVHYSGHRYGTLRDDVEARLAAGYDVVLEIELQGARAVRAALPEAVSVFIAPPSLSELAARLKGRGTESAAAVAQRLHIAEREVAAADEFDHIVVNDDADRAATEVAEIVEARRKEHGWTNPGSTSSSRTREGRATRS